MSQTDKRLRCFAPYPDQFKIVSESWSSLVPGIQYLNPLDVNSLNRCMVEPRSLIFCGKRNPINFSGPNSVTSIFLDVYVMHAKLFGSCLTLYNPMGYIQPRLLCPQNFSGKNSREGCQFLPRAILPTQGSHLHLLCHSLQVDSSPLSHQGSQYKSQLL